MSAKMIKIIVLIFMLATGSYRSLAQYTFFRPEESFAIEVSLENSSYLRLPMYRNAISSLIVKGDDIIGGTSARKGLTPFLFVASLSQRKLTGTLDLNTVVPDQQSIRSGFCRGRNGILFAGTMPREGKKGSGHLISVAVSAPDSLRAVDLGAPVPGEGIFALTGNAEGTVLYGISYPSGLFFSYHIDSGNTQVYDSVAPTEKDLRAYDKFALKPEDYLSKKLISDNQGRIYGSAPVNKLFYFDPETKSFHIMEDSLPLVWGRGILGSVDAWTKSEAGVLYGGNSGDGQLFRLDPATLSVTNLGKPVMMNRLKGLTFARDGKLYGIAGASPGYAHLFSYDPGRGGYQDLGNPQFKMTAPGIEQGIAWRGFQLGTMAVSEDGKYIVMGEDEALSQLLIFAVD